MSKSADSNSAEPKQTADPRPDPAQGDGTAGWLYALNSFLEHAFLDADRDTGC